MFDQIMTLESKLKAVMKESSEELKVKKDLEAKVRELASFRVLNARLKSMYPRSVLSLINQRYQKMLLLMAFTGKMDLTNDSVVSCIIAGSKNNFLHKLKYKAHVPLKDAMNLIGICDETGTLAEGEVFV